MAYSPYLVLAAFRGRTIMPAEDVDALEAVAPGWILTRLTTRSAWIDARLAKRYQVPFSPTDPPEVVLEWLVALVTYDCYLKRGFNPSAAEDAEIEKNYLEAKAEIKEAADSKDGEFDLPLIQSADGASGVTRQAPLGYSEASPYTWIDVEADSLSRGPLDFPR